MNIFISYRHAEHEVGIAARGLAQTLRNRGETVFMDVEIPPLANWKSVLHDAVSQSSIMLVAIGPIWLELLRERMKSDEPDWVRFEIATALARGIPVGAVLFGGAKVPAEQDMPEDIRGLADRQAVSLNISSPKEFDRDCNAFIASLEKNYDKPRAQSLQKTRKKSKATEIVLNPSPLSELVNTTWEWPGAGTVTFEAGGKARFSQSAVGGNWELTGNHLRFDCNNFTMFDVIVEGDTMSGEWYRIKDNSERAATLLKRVGGRLTERVDR